MMEFLLYFFIDPGTGDVVHDAFHHHLPVVQFPGYCAVLPIPFLMLNQHSVFEAADSLGFSAVSCIFFELLSQLTRKLRRFKRALGFYGEVLAVRSDDTIGFGYANLFTNQRDNPH